jgi:hypothetical protein
LGTTPKYESAETAAAGILPRMEWYVFPVVGAAAFVATMFAAVVWVATDSLGAPK